MKMYMIIINLVKQQWGAWVYEKIFFIVFLWQNTGAFASL